MQYSMAEHLSVYRWSLEDAKKHNEIDLWRESHKSNCDCARAIEKAINENYHDILNEISPDIAVQYLLLLWMDTVCYNMDRHTENFGLLRDVKTGRIISLAPNYDNNIALIAKGYPTDVRRGHDGLIGFLKTFIQGSEEAHEMYRQIKPLEITERMIDECMDEIPIKADRDYIRSFVLNGQEKVREIICADIEPNEDNTIGIML